MRSPTTHGLVFLSLAGCAFEPPPAPADVPDVIEPDPIQAPELVAMMRSEVRVGETLAFDGYGFLDAGDGHVDVTFRGTFAPYGSRPVPVNLTVAIQKDQDDLLEMPFGPFKVPFTRAGNEAGIFRGKLFATNRAYDGRERRQAEASWPEVELTVLPSVIVRALAPRSDPDLDIGPPDVLESTPYLLMIESVGFEPAVIEYRLGASLTVDGEQRDVVTHDAIGPVDVLGEREVLIFGPVPSEVDSYPATIVVYVQSVTGETIALDLTAVVHRELAQVFGD